MSNYSLVVGNVGTVWKGSDSDAADVEFALYQRISESGKSRAGNESVTLLCDGDILREHKGKYSEDA